MSEELILIDKTSSAEETKQCAAFLAPLLGAGDVVVLTGDLGAGKTQFVQGIAEGLGIDANVTSPTFNILLIYDGGRLPLKHFDLYRLDDARQLEDIGFYEILENDGATFIEWGEKFPSELPDDRLEICIRGNVGTERLVEATAYGSRSKDLLHKWVAKRK